MTTIEDLTVAGTKEGPPVRPVTSRWPAFDAECLAAAAEVLSTGRVNYWTGEQGKSFEREYAAAVGCRYGVALSNGTVALELALRALDIGPGDDVLVPSRSFIASASAAVAVGARPVWLDVDAESQNLTVDTVDGGRTSRTRAVIAVHLAGWPVDIASLREYADDRGIVVVEDCAQAHGAAYCDVPVGSLGHAAAWSFCQDKILTTAGEGGMVTTNDRRVWERVWSYKDHGKNVAALQPMPESPSFRWLHDSFGTNARMPEVAAAVGRVGLRRLAGWVARRRHNAALLDARLGGVAGLRTTVPPAQSRHAYYRYYAFVEREQLRPGWTRDRVLTQVRAAGVPCGVGTCGEIYRERACPPQWRPHHPLPVARRLADTSVMLPVDPTLSDDDVHRMAAVLIAVMAQAAG